MTDATRIRALVVDDEPLARSMIREMLESDSGVEVVGECANGREAVEVIKSSAPDIVFLDLELPDGGGIPVAQHLVRDARKRRPRLIALTKHSEDPMYAKARAAGFERLLLKPVSHQELDRILGISEASVQG